MTELVSFEISIVTWSTFYNVVMYILPFVFIYAVFLLEKIVGYTSLLKEIVNEIKEAKEMKNAMTGKLITVQQCDVVSLPEEEPVEDSEESDSKNESEHEKTEDESDSEESEECMSEQEMIDWYETRYGVAYKLDKRVLEKLKRKKCHSKQECKPSTNVGYITYFNTEKNACIRIVCKNCANRFLNDNVIRSITHFDHKIKELPQWGQDYIIKHSEN